MAMRTARTMGPRVLGVCLVLASGAGAAAERGWGDGQPPAAAGDPAATPTAAQPAVNPLAHDRNMWHSLLVDHASIRRTVRHSLEDGAGTVRATTESDDPDVAARIIDHARAMQARMAAGARVRVWDGVFKELFERHGEVSIEVTVLERGVSIAETSREAEATALMRAHAMGVSDFVRLGFAASSEPTPRLEVGALPPTELSLGGVRHRFLLEAPDAESIAMLGARGVGTLIEFVSPSQSPVLADAVARVASERPAGAAIDPSIETQAAPDAPMHHVVVRLGDADDGFERFLDEARAAIQAADESSGTAALLCRDDGLAAAAWLAWRAIDAGVPWEIARREAAAIGGLDPEREAAVLEYAKVAWGAESKPDAKAR